MSQTATAYGAIRNKLSGNKENAAIDKTQELTAAWFQGLVDICYLFLFFKLNFSTVATMLENCKVNGSMEIKKMDLLRLKV